MSIRSQGQMMKNSNDWTVLSPCVAYTTIIIQISVGETGG